MKAHTHYITELLRSRGLRPTRASRFILARLGHSNEHLGAEGLRRVLRRRGHQVSTATLYQNLKRLTDAGLLVSFVDSEGLVRFDANTAPHAHIVCSQCGCIADLPFDDERASHLGLKLPRKARTWRGWSVRSARLELRGLCPRCR